MPRDVPADAADGRAPPAGIRVRCYEELNDFLPAARRKREFIVPFRDRTTVRDLVEALGVPPEEVDLVLVNGASVDFSTVMGPGDRISVFPVFETFDISGLTRLRPAPLRVPCFVLDSHLGKLARYLRLLGFDCLYDRQMDEPELAALAGAAPRRILLSRDRGLLQRSAVTHGHLVRATDPEQQALEVLRRFDLAGVAQPFRRCSRCNGLVRDTGREFVRGRVPADVWARFETFSCCESCHRVCWHGSHYARLQGIISRLLQAAAERDDGPG